MKKHLAAVLAGALATSFAQAEPVSLQALEQRLAAQEARLQQLEREAANKTALSTADIRLSGYINAIGQSTNLSQSGPDYYGANNIPAFTQFSSGGLQIDAKVNNKVSGTIQFHSNGGDNFDTRMEWGYVGYQATDNLKLRAGRMVAPFFMHSQYYRVGYAYAWSELPEEMYEQAPVRTFDGIDFIYQFTTGNIAHSLNVYYGSQELPLPLFGQDLTYTLEKAAGINLTSNFGNWTTWLAYNTSESSYPLPDLTAFGGPNLAPFSADRADGYFASAGVQYDNGRFIFMAEGSQLDITEVDWIPRSHAGYVMTGVRAGIFTPYVSWAFSEDLDFDDVLTKPNDLVKGSVIGPFDPTEELLYQQSGERHQKSWTFGVRADVAANLAVKFDVSRYYDIGNRENVYDSQAAARITGNPFPLALPGPGKFSAANNNFLLKEDKPLVFRVSANFVF